MDSRQRRGFCSKHHICVVGDGVLDIPQKGKNKICIKRVKIEVVDEWRLFCVAKKSFAYALVSKLPRLRLACAPHLQQSCKRWFETTLSSAKEKRHGRKIYRAFFGGDEWIRTTAPVIPTYTLSRGASSANLSTSP